MVRKNGPVSPLSPELENCCPPCPPTPPLPGPVVSVRSVNGKSGDVVLENLTVGSKQYNGSSPVELSPTDLDLLKSIVFRKSVGTIQKALEFIEKTDKVGDTCFCAEDRKFYMATGEGQYLSWVTGSAVLEKQVDWEEEDPLDPAFIKNKPDLTVFALKNQAGNKMTLTLDQETFELTARLYDVKDNVLSTSTVDLPVEEAIKSGSYDPETKSIILKKYSGETITISLVQLIADLATKAELTQAVADVKTWVEDKHYLVAADIENKLNVLPGDEHTSGNAYNLPYFFYNEPSEDRVILHAKTVTLDNKKTYGDYSMAIAPATTTTAGIMSAADRVALNNKLDKIADLEEIRQNAIDGAIAKSKADKYGNIVTHNTSEFATAAQGAKADSAVLPAAIADMATNASVNGKLSNYYKSVVVDEKLTTKQDVISDLSTIRDNATAGKSASTTISAYGDIVKHNVSEFATAAQGAKADTALQQADIADMATKTWVEGKGYLTTADVANKLNILEGDTQTGGDAYKLPYQFYTQASTTDVAVHTKTVTLDNKKTYGDTSFNIASATQSTAGIMSAADKKALDGKQDKIADLDTIRSGASAGATAVQPAALTAYSLVSETGNKVDLELDSETYKLVAKLYDKSNNLISTSTVIDLPMEQMIVNVTYDAATKELIFTLKNGNTVRVGIGSIITGLATQDWVQAQGYLTEHQSLAAYSTTELMNNAIALHHDSTKQDVISDLSSIRDNAMAGKDAKEIVTTYGNIVTHDTDEFATATQGAKADTAVQPAAIANMATTSYVTTALANYYNKDVVDNKLEKKLNTIDDLSTIRSNAEAGKQASVTIDGYGDVVTHSVSEFATAAQGAKADTALQEHQSLADYYTKSLVDTSLATKQDTISDLETIRSGAALGATALQEHQDISGKADLTYVNNQLALKANSADLATVATSGKYSDLSGVPTKVSAFTNDAGYLTEHQSLANYYTKSQVDTSLEAKQDTIDDISYIRNNALAGKQASVTIGGYGDIVTHSVSEFATAAQGALADTALQPSALNDYSTTVLMQTAIAAHHDDTKQNVLTAGTNITIDGTTISAKDTTYTEATTSKSGLMSASDKTKLNGLATVATSGKYSDLSGAPTKVSEFTNDAGYLTEHQSLANYSTTAQMNTAISTATNDMATKTWVEGKGYLTEHQSLANYSTTAQMNTAISTATNDMATKTWVEGKGYLTEHLSLANYSTTAQMNTAIAAYHDSTKLHVLKAGNNITITPGTDNDEISAVDTTYSAGTGISISAENVISCTAESKLVETLKADYAVGGIAIGDEFKAGTSIEAVLRALLCTKPVLQSIAVTTPPTKTTYTVGEVFDPTGMVVKATYSSGDPKVITDYTYSPTTALTLADNKITITYEGKTTELAIVVLSESFNLYYGATFNPPTDLTGLTLDSSVTKEQLLSSGYTRVIHVEIDPETEMGQYPVIAVSSSVNLAQWVATEFPLGPLSYNTVDKGSYKLYYLTGSTTDDISYTFTFAEA